MKLVEAPKSRRDWLKAADQCCLETIAGTARLEGESVKSVMITLGPKYYVQRVHERLAAEYGYVVASVKKQGQMLHPATGETNTIYGIDFKRKQ